VLAGLVASGCIRAPTIVMVDRATALEAQAGGSYDEVEKRLDRIGMAPVPVPLTPNQLEALGIAPLPLVDATGITPADHLDALLAKHCMGEGRDGLVVDTHRACHARTAPDDAALLERVNGARRQLWRWMHTVRPDVSLEALRQAWQKAHLQGVVCGGWIQAPDGTWSAKGC